HADTLIAHYREAKAGAGKTAGNTPANSPGAIGGSTEIYRVEAEGHVLLKRDQQNVVGDRLVYDIDRAVAVITGKNLKLTTPTDAVTAHDSLEWYDQKQIAVARGDAVASRNGKTVKADILTAYMVKTAPAAGGAAARPGKRQATQAAAKTGPASENSKISRVDAQGHVVISNGPDTGRGDFGVYNAETGIATLIGNVVIERGKDVIRGQRGVMDLNKNISRMLPGGSPGSGPAAARGGGHQRVQGLFVRQEHAVHPGASGASPAPGAGERHR
ncbi:MAG: LptA/OstA family protein, partial [Thiohalocapsa sp.]